MRMAKGNLSQAARLLHISRETLRYRIKKHFLDEIRGSDFGLQEEVFIADRGYEAE